MTMTAPERYRKKQTEDRDLVKVAVWVPTRHRGALLETAKKLRSMRGADVSVDVKGDAG